MFWVVYGIFLRPHIIFPNLIGIIVSSALLWFISKHRKDFPSIKENETTSTIKDNKTEIDESKNEFKINDKIKNSIKFINRLALK